MKTTGEIKDHVDLLRLLYRTGLHWLVMRAKDVACRVSTCQTKDRVCNGKCGDTFRNTDIQAFIDSSLSSPTASDALWIHASSVLDYAGDVSTGAMVKTLIAINHNLAGWLLQNHSTRLFHHLIRIIQCWKKGPPVPSLPNQFIFPCVSIHPLDKKMGVEAKVAEYKSFWQFTRTEVTAELAVFPPKTALEENIFRVTIPHFRALY